MLAEHCRGNGLLQTDLNFCVNFYLRDLSPWLKVADSLARINEACVTATFTHEGCTLPPNPFAIRA